MLLIQNILYLTLQDNRGSYISAHVLLHLLKELRKNNVRGFDEHPIVFPQQV